MRAFTPLITLVVATAVCARPFSIDTGALLNSDTLGQLWSLSKELVGQAPAVVPAAIYDGKEDKTIWAQLTDDPQYSKLVKVLKTQDDIVKLLDDKAKQLTFFAPNNDALPDHHDHDEYKHDPHTSRAHAAIAHVLRDGGGGDDKDDRRHKIILRIINALAKYHTLLYPASFNDLAGNSTVWTSLIGSPFESDKSFDGQWRRLRVETKGVQPLVTLELNWAVNVVEHDIKASNGFIQRIDKPLIPPPSVLDTLFFVPDVFSTFTSSIQKVGLDGDLQYRYAPGSKKGDKGSFHGAPAVTLFAPTNDAFSRLPERLRLWLFSPFGERALHKLLQFHMVPNWLVFSEWIHEVKVDGRGKDWIDVADSNDFDFKIQVATALEGHLLPLHITKKPSPVPWQYPVITVTVNGLDDEGTTVPRDGLDGIAANGAWHAVTEVLDPRGRKPQFDAQTGASSWDDWEEWMPQWAQRD